MRLRGALVAVAALAACDHLFDVCGNGELEEGEECDLGAMNGKAGAPCTATCQTDFCGDGHFSSLEACDDGNTLGADGCQPGCRLPTCGDGWLDPGEQCDESTLVSGLGCAPSCDATTCGDGVLALGEHCYEHVDLRAGPPLAVGDVDGDGTDEVLGVHDGSFEIFVGPALSGVMAPELADLYFDLFAGDLDGDGDDDLVAFGPSGRSLFAAEGGTFVLGRTIGPGDPGQYCGDRTVLADLNGDGRNDYFNACDGLRWGSSATLLDWFNPGPSVGVELARAVAADVDGDGDLDLVGYTPLYPMGYVRQLIVVPFEAGVPQPVVAGPTLSAPVDVAAMSGELFVADAGTLLAVEWLGTEFGPPRAVALADGTTRLGLARIVVADTDGDGEDELVGLSYPDGLTALTFFDRVGSEWQQTGRRRTNLAEDAIHRNVDTMAVAKLNGDPVADLVLPGLALRSAP